MAFTEQQVGAMTAAEIGVRLAIKLGVVQSVTFVDPDTDTVVAVWDIDDWQNANMPLWWREIRYFINPMAPGPCSFPPTVCSDEDECTAYEELAATLFSYPGGSGDARARAEALLLWLDANAGASP